MLMSSCHNDGSSHKVNEPLPVVDNSGKDSKASKTQKKEEPPQKKPVKKFEELKKEEIEQLFSEKKAEEVIVELEKPPKVSVVNPESESKKDIKKLWGIIPRIQEFLNHVNHQLHELNHQYGGFAAEQAGPVLKCFLPVSGIYALGGAKSHIPGAVAGGMAMGSFLTEHVIPKIPKAWRGNLAVKDSIEEALGSVSGLLLFNHLSTKHHVHAEGLLFTGISDHGHAYYGFEVGAELFGFRVPPLTRLGVSIGKRYKWSTHGEMQGRKVLSVGEIPVPIAGYPVKFSAYLAADYEDYEFFYDELGLIVNFVPHENFVGGFKISASLEKWAAAFSDMRKGKLNRKAMIQCYQNAVKEGKQEESETENEEENTPSGLADL